jgi:hypothetical protein
VVQRVDAHLGAFSSMLGLSETFIIQIGAPARCCRGSPWRS